MKTLRGAPGRPPRHRPQNRPPQRPAGPNPTDKFNPAKPYKSIYASDDAKLLQGPTRY